MWLNPISVGLLLLISVLSLGNWGLNLSSSPANMHNTLLLEAVKPLVKMLSGANPTIWEWDMATENQELRKAGLKVTLPRVKILQIMESTETKHLSAEDVYKALIEADEDVGLATVYRVLTQFESAGLVMRHHFEGGSSVFELTTIDHHDHIVCQTCGRVEEF